MMSSGYRRMPGTSGEPGSIMMLGTSSSLWKGFGLPSESVNSHSVFDSEPENSSESKLSLDVSDSSSDSSSLRSSESTSVEDSLDPPL